MIHYTMIPQELIFPSDEHSYSNQRECTWNGIPLLVEENDHMFKVVRVMSSNPADFLRGEIQPGSHIHMHETE